MKMNKIISYIHLLGCVGWSIFVLCSFMAKEIDPDSTGILLLTGIFATTASGVYLFIIRRKKQPENIKTSNTNIIISLIHFLGCIGLSIFGLVLLIDGLSEGQHMDILVLFAFSACFATTASGIYLFLFRYVIWRKDLAQLCKRKNLVILWTGVLLIILMCLFPPFVSDSSTGYRHGYSYFFSNTISVADYKSFDGSYIYKSLKAHIDFVRLVIPCAIVGLITVALLYTLKDKKAKEG
jgi:hypothetical protein